MSSSFAPSTGHRACERVVVLTTSYPAFPDDPGGHFVAAEVSKLRASGHEVTVLAPLPGDARPGDARPSTSPDVRWLPGGGAFGWPGALARLEQRPTRALGVLRFVRAARRELRSLAPFDRLVAHFIVPSVWPILDGLALDAQALEAVAHGSDVRLLARLPALARRRVARTLAPFAVRCASEELRRALGAALGEDLGRRARVQPSPLELPPPPGRATARQELGVPASARLLVVVGRLITKKRVAVALRAARLVPGASVVVVGDGPERAPLEREFPEARFVGLVDRGRALRWLAAADVCLSASLEEGASSVVREARWLGTPVVALPSGDLAASAEADPGLWVVPASGPA